MIDVREWLTELGLEVYGEAFEENAIDGETLSTLVGDDLKELGVGPLGHRKKLLAAIARLSAPAEAAPESAPGQPQPPAEIPGEVEGERRQVAILFADLCGFTALSQELGAEETHGLLARVMARLDGVVAEFGGHVDKHIGDSVMALFGAPVAHGNDPERAALAALEMQAAMGELSQAEGRDLRLHSGIASGRVVASGKSDAGYSVIGDSVNLAARLMEAAGPGDVLLSDDLKARLPASLQCRTAGLLTLKGIAQPVAAWHLTGQSDDRAPAADRPFVGRRTELGQLQGLLAACREVGSGQAILLRGEAGIGKTHLLRQFCQGAEQAGFRSYQGLVLDFGAGRGQDAVHALVRALLGLPLGAEAPARRAAADAALAEGLLPEDDAVFLFDLLDLPQPPELRALYDAMDNRRRNEGRRELLTRLVRQRAAEAPVLLLVEDIHWAEPAVLDHLSALARTAAATPVLLVMTSRIEGDPLDRTWRAAAGDCPLATIDLGPLRNSEAQELAATFVQGFDGAVAEDYLAACITRAGGHPLFLDQLLQSARDRARAALQSGAEGNGDGAVPATIQSLVLSRMDQLDPRDRRALQVASVIGQRFELAALHHLLEQPDYDPAPLVAHLLVRPEGGGLLFGHALIREGVYDSLLTAQARALHGKAAAWFADSDPALHAEHLERAQDPAAAAAYLAAAAAEKRLYRPESALKLARRGKDLAQSLSDQVAAHLAEGALLQHLGDNEPAFACFQAARDIAENPADIREAQIAIADNYRQRGEFAEGLRALEDAEIAEEGAERPLALAKIFHFRGALNFSLGNTETCLAQHLRANQEAERAGGRYWISRTLSGVGDAYYSQGRITTGTGYFRRCLDIAEKEGFGEIVVANGYMLGNHLRYGLEVREGYEVVTRYRRLAERVANRRALLFSAMLVGDLGTELLDLEPAGRALQQSLETAKSIGNSNMQTYVLCLEGRRLWLAGREEAAREVLLGALADSNRLSPRFVGARIRGSLALLTDNPAARRVYIDEAEALLAQGCVTHNHFSFRHDMMELGLRLGDAAFVRQQIAATEAFTAAEPVPWCDYRIARARALLAWRESPGDPETLRTLEALRAQGDAAGALALLPAIEAALAER